MGVLHSSRARFCCPERGFAMIQSIRLTKMKTAVLLIFASALMLLVSTAQPALAKDFPDVAEDQWYESAISYVSDEGFITGYSNGSFGPTDTLTRAQSAVILCRYYGGQGSSEANADMPDIQTGQYYTQSANWAVDAGVFSGKDINGKRYFDPSGKLTRAELCALISKAAKIFAGTEITGGDDKLAAMPDEAEVPNWARTAVAWGLENGVISGKKGVDGKRYVAANDTVTRAEMAAIIKNAVDNLLLGGEALGEVSVGDTVTFGTYEQDGKTSDGKEAIEWQVLDVQGGNALLISKYALDVKPYNDERTNVTWETCSLRAWLNSDFVTSALTVTERASIVTTTVSTPDDTYKGTPGGNDTKDRVFVLSAGEAEQYFGSYDERACDPTEYARAKIYGTNSAGRAYWWLRTPGSSADRAAYVNSAGSVRSGTYGGSEVNTASVAVRPAVWIRL